MSNIPYQAPCKYFTICGGCSIQHIEQHGDYKMQHLLKELEKLNFATINPIIHPLVQVSQRSRRRANFKINDYHLSFNKSKSKQLVAIDDCLLLEDSLNSLIKPLNQYLRKLKVKIEAISMLSSDTGVELQFHTQERSDLNCDQLLSEFAQKFDIARIAWNAHLLAQYKPVQLQFAQGWVDLPIGSFLQVSRESNTLMTKIILDHLDNDKKILELYCGCGSFTIPMSDKASITAIEGNSEAVAALNKAAQRHTLKINASQRDLYLSPLLVDELNQYTQLVINPPRNGSTPQFRQIANARKIQKVIMVSCSVDNFIRDGKILLESGFKLQAIHPIDQFLYSDHLELIASFSR